MIKLYKIIFFLNLLLFTFSVQGYELPNYRNNSIVLSFGDDLWGKVVENKNYIPFLNFLDVNKSIVPELSDYEGKLSREKAFLINLSEDSMGYWEAHAWFPKNSIFTSIMIDTQWNKFQFMKECVQPMKSECKEPAELIDHNDDNITNIKKYIFKGNLYYTTYRNIKYNEKCIKSRKFKKTDSGGIKYWINVELCSNEKNNVYVNNIALSEQIHNEITINNSLSFRQLENFIKNNEEIEKQKKTEEKRKEKERQKKLEEDEEKKKREQVEKKKEAERQKKLEQKKKELEEKRKQEEEKRKIEEELRKEAEEKKRKQEEEEKKREAEEKRKEELQKNIQDSKSALSVAKKNQNKLITETKNLELQFKEIKSANTIQKIDDIMEITNKIYDTTQTYIKSFDVNYERVERLFNKNPETELNLIFNEFKLLNTQINNQKNVISEINMEIIDIHTNKKNKFEKELRDKELTDAFMRSDQAYIYTYAPMGIAVVLLLILLWRWNSSGRQIVYLHNKIRDLERNNEKLRLPTTQVPKSFGKISKQVKTNTTNLKTPEKSNIKEEENINIEEPISNEIEKLNNLIDDKTFMDKYQNALSDLNSLRSFTDEFKVKGLERFSSQRLEEGVELEFSQRIVDKAMFWLIEHPQTFELLILPGRDLWSRSRLLLQDTSRFGYLNFNGIFDLSEGEEFKLTNFAIVSVTEKNKYKIEQKGELILPKSN